MRALVGETCVIGVELDPHCHLTEKRCALADIIVLFKEYPHTDFAERGEEVVDLVLRTIRREIKPVKSVFDCRMIASFPTSIQPMRGLVDRIMALEGKERVLSVSIGHCFPYGDVPECGARILVITDDAKPHGDRLAEQIGRELISFREQAAPPEYSVDGAIDFALAQPGGPVVIADTTDNAGGGAPSDNTTFLHRLIARGVEGAAVAPIWDPIAVRLAFDAGEGARLPFRFGGKTARSSGPPVDAEVEVIRCVPNAHQTFAGAIVPLGDVASIRMGGVEAVLISTRAQAMGSDLFSNFGIDPTQAQNPRGQIEPALLRVVLEDRRAGDLRRRRRSAAARLPQAALGQDPAPDLAARCGDGTAAHHLTRSASAWPNSCNGRARHKRRGS